MSHVTRNLLRRHRERLAISQEEAAKRAGDVSVNTWKNWEAMRVVPQLARYRGIADALEISIEQVQDAVRQIEQHLLRKRGAA